MTIDQEDEEAQHEGFNAGVGGWEQCVMPMFAAMSRRRLQGRASLYPARPFTSSAR